MPRTTRLLLLLLSACVLSVLQQRVKVNADTKVLNILSLNQPGNSRYEVISLENAGTADEELVIKGNRTVELGPPNSLGLIYMVVTEYTADNNGYRVHSRIVAVPLLETRLSSSLLMSAAG